jgi:iron complex transport system substrate-binding protein
MAARSAGEEASVPESHRPVRGTPVPQARRWQVVLQVDRWRVLAVGLVLVASVLLVSACASSTNQGGPAATSTRSSQRSPFPVSVNAANGEITIEQRPDRIVSLSPTATEMLFAIGGGVQVVAADQDSSYPPQAPTTKLSGYEPNVEAIAKYDPDLVVISNDVGGLVKSLGKLSVPVLLEPAARNLHDTYAQIEQLGAATGHLAAAAHLVESMKSTIQRLVASAPRFSHSLTYYHELDQTYYTATSNTFIGQLYGLLGLRNIADEVTGASGGYPQLSAEYIIKADPDVIFLADAKCCGQSAKTVAKRPGWDQVQAVKDGAVFGLDDDIVSRWGPRVVDFLRVVVQDLERLHERVSS